MARPGIWPEPRRLTLCGYQRRDSALVRPRTMSQVSRQLFRSGHRVKCQELTPLPNPTPRLPKEELDTVSVLRQPIRRLAFPAERISAEFDFFHQRAGVEKRPIMVKLYYHSSPLAVPGSRSNGGRGVPPAPLGPLASTRAGIPQDSTILSFHHSAPNKPNLGKSHLEGKCCSDKDLPCVGRGDSPHKTKPISEGVSSVKCQVLGRRTQRPALQAFLLQTSHFKLRTATESPGGLYKRTQFGVSSSHEGCHGEQTKPISGGTCGTNKQTQFPDKAK